jgi:futalosine hydrolase
MTPPAGFDPSPTPGPPWLLVVAAPAEVAAVLTGLGHPHTDNVREWVAVPVSDSLDLITTGVGKVNAAAATMLACRARAYGGVLNLGIAGSLPIATPLDLGSTIAATRSIYADEGLALPDGSFVGCADMGFPLGPFDDWGIRGNPHMLDRFAPLADLTAPIATVSTCSATDALARVVVERTWSVAEAMEGAAVGHVAARLGLPFLELRVVSNTTGDRAQQRWDIRRALDRLRALSQEVGAKLEAR